MKIEGIEQHYDFGFGVDSNVFGCFCESYMLAADKMQNITPTLGDVDFVNFQNMLSAYKQLGVDVGDFKCLEEYIPSGRLVTMLNSKQELKATIPFKNVCWIFKVDDLHIPSTLENVPS